MTSYSNTPGKDFFKKIRTYDPNKSILKPDRTFDSNKSSKVSTHALPKIVSKIGKSAYGVTPNVEMEYNFNLSAKNLDLLHLNPTSDTRLKDIVDCKPLDNEYIFKMIHFPLSHYSSKKFKHMHLNIYALNSYLKFLYHDKALSHLRLQREKKYGSGDAQQFWMAYDKWNSIELKKIEGEILNAPDEDKDHFRRKKERFLRDEGNGRTILRCIIEGGYIEDFVKQIYSKNKKPGSKSKQISEYIVDVSILASTIQGAVKLFQPFGIVNSQTEYIHPHNKWEEYNRRKDTAKDDYLSVQTFGRMRTFPMFKYAVHGDFIAVYAIQIDCGPVQFFFYKSINDLTYLKFLFLYGNSNKAADEHKRWKRYKKGLEGGGGGGGGSGSGGSSSGQLGTQEKPDGVITINDDDKYFQEGLDDEEEGEGEAEYDDDDDDDEEKKLSTKIDLKEKPQPNFKFDTQGKGEKEPFTGMMLLPYDETNKKLEKIVIKKVRNVYQIRMDEKEKYEDFEEVEMLKRQGVFMNFDSQLKYKYPEKSSKIVCTELQKKMTQQVALIDVDVILL